ncbi:hypothetical protein RND71_040508 [Anisodus tanguticus]|uniref:Uncharacterized protein n=1 Tax=Anisodus tanguticus TaxID=243964 RepID=A0AAE1QTJ9_9SOLA|nr:hypothetical protein RND71_040508 [Anisodus tanguticus]
MDFVQRRKGPDVVGSFGLLQPLARWFEIDSKRTYFTKRSEQKYARLLSCSLVANRDRSPPRSIGARFFENIFPIFGDKGRNDLSIYLRSPRRKTSSRRSPLLRSPLRLGRCPGQEP